MSGWPDLAPACLKVRSPLVALLLVALVLRVLYVLWGPTPPPQDTADYDEIALNLLGGQGFVAHDNWFGYPMRSWRAPLYPFFLAGVYAVAGHSHWAVKAIQTVLGTATVAIVYALARRLYPASALLAAAVAAVYGPLVASANEVMTETLFTLLLTGAALLASRSREGPHGSASGSGSDLAAGAAVGLAALTRPVGLLLWPAILVARAWEARGRLRSDGAVRRHWLRGAAWLTAGLIATVCPWTIRNALVHGTLVPITTHGGFIIARSNTEPADWRRPDGWRLSPEDFQRTPSEEERDRQWLRQGLRAIAQNPGTYLRLAGERFLRFWYFFTPAYNFWFMLVAPFFAAGLWRFGRAPGWALPGALIGISVAVYSLVLYGSTRFRLPLEPLFIIYGAAFLCDLWRRRGRVRVMAWGGTAAVLNLLILWQAEPLRRGLLGLLSAGGLK